MYVSVTRHAIYTVSVATQNLVLQFMCHLLLYSMSLYMGPGHFFVLFFKGMSALHTAVQKGNCDIIKMLLDAGADANQRVRGRLM